jgi:hypothetical protein
MSRYGLYCQCCLLLFAVVLVGTSGCDRSQPQPGARKLCDQLAVESGDRYAALKALLAMPDRGDNLMELFSGWGRRNACYDRMVVSLLYNATESDADLLLALQNRLHDDPTLLQQLLRTEQLAERKARLHKSEIVKSSSGVDVDTSIADTRNSPWPLVRIYYKQFTNCSRRDLMLSSIIWLSAEFDQPEVILRLKWPDIEQEWRNRGQWLKKYAKFTFFDFRANRYVVDEEAFRQQRFVPPERQEIVTVLGAREDP